METSLTVLFEDPFWVLGFECIEDGKLSASMGSFGGHCVAAGSIKFGDSEPELIIYKKVPTAEAGE